MLNLFEFFPIVIETETQMQFIEINIYKIYKIVLQDVQLLGVSNFLWWIINLKEVS